MARGGASVHTVGRSPLDAEEGGRDSDASPRFRSPARKNTDDRPRRPNMGNREEQPDKKGCRVPMGTTTARGAMAFAFSIRRRPPCSTIPGFPIRTAPGFSPPADHLACIVRRRDLILVRGDPQRVGISGRSAQRDIVVFAHSGCRGGEPAPRVPFGSALSSAVSPVQGKVRIESLGFRYRVEGLPSYPVVPDSVPSFHTARSSPPGAY